MRNLIILLYLSAFFFSCTKDCTETKPQLLINCRDGYKITKNLDTCYNFKNDLNISFKNADGFHYYSPLILPNNHNKIIYSSVNNTDGVQESLEFKLVNLCDTSEQINYININLDQFSEDVPPKWLNSIQFIYKYADGFQIFDLESFTSSSFNNNWKSVNYLEVDSLSKKIYIYCSINGQFNNYILNYNGDIIGTLPEQYRRFNKYIVHGEKLLGVFSVLDDEFNATYYFAIFDFALEELEILKEIPIFIENSFNSEPRNIVRYKDDEIIFTCYAGLYKYNLTLNEIYPIIETHCDLRKLVWLQYSKEYGDYCILKSIYGYYLENPPPNTNAVYTETNIELVNIETGEEWKIEGLP